MTALVVGAGLSAAPAGATISQPQVIDGPSAALRELGGVTLAADGTGGVIYRKDEDGRAHVYVAQFSPDGWRAPQRVDTGPAQTFASSSPVLAAGNGGRLVAIWVQEFGAADRMFSATLQPGARRFEAPVPVDLNVGDSDQGIAPQVAMAPGGQALLVYRVVTDAQPAGAADGAVLAEIRVARLTGQLWSSLGTPVNRNLASAQPALTPSNGPQIGVDQTGAGVVAWQELDDELIPRVYARRIFSSATGIATLASPRVLDGVPARGADAFSLAVGPFGEAALTWRQQPAGPEGAPRIWLTTMPDQFAKSAAAFLPPRLADGGGARAPGGGALGRPAVSVVGPEALVGLSVGSTAQSIDVTDAELAAPKRLDRGDAIADPGTRVALGSDGSAALAWKVAAGGRGYARLQERRSDGVLADRLLTGPRGGGVDALQLAGSGLGDGLAAFTQGTGEGRQLIAAVVDAAPQTFAVQAPIGWVRDKSVTLSWDAAAHAIGGVRYAVVVDDDEVASNLRGTTQKLRTRDLDAGVSTVAVVATDSSGQETSSIPAALRYDRTKPTAKTRLQRRRLTVKLGDAKGSGVVAKSVKVSYGNGRSGKGRRTLRVTYRAAGTYRVTISAKDKAGNALTLRKTVRVR